MKNTNNSESRSFFRFHHEHRHTASVFGSNWFALKAEAFARFFGTPIFLIGQTIVVIIWITLNQLGHLGFDPYPFILLNLAFSLQAAYAAPLILLAQTRQADRDKVNIDADARHREELAQNSQKRLDQSVEQNEHILLLLEQNNQLTERVETMNQRIELLTKEIHVKIVNQ